MRSTPFFASMLAPIYLATQSAKTAQCMSSEEEAAMLQKLMHDQGGQMDPEEMQHIIRKARG
jgi:HD superfamily phosphohydrolase YqeK